MGWAHRRNRRAWGRLARQLVAGAALVVLGGGVVDLPAWPIHRILGAAQRMGPTAEQGATALQVSMNLAASAGGLPAGRGRLDAVNLFYNRRLVFRDDLENWGQVDFWASPLQALNKGAADCEDYAIAKYFTLVAMGVPHANLRLVYVRAMVGGPDGVAQPHMVLAFYADPAEEPLILDNLISEVRPASRRSDLTPVFSFNADGLWQGVGETPASGHPTVRLSRWREVLERARDEGFM